MDGIPEARDDLFPHFKETAVLGATTNVKVNDQRKQVRA